MTVIQGQTHIRCDGCGTPGPAGLGIVRARVLARAEGWRADGSRRPDLCSTCLHRETTIEQYEKLIRRIGPGFHPDTPYDGYEPPLDFIRKNEFERVLHNMFALEDYDPYSAGLDMFE